MRKRRDWTQVQLAAKAGLGQSAISSIENDETLWLRGGNLLRLAAALEVSAKWLETGRGDPQPPVGAGTDEAAVLDILRSMTPELRAAWIAAGRGMLAALPGRKPNKSDPFPTAKAR